MAGVLGPACFVGTWVLAGALRPGYSPVRDAISQLARTGAPRRALMTTAFVVFGVSIPVFGRALRNELAVSRWCEASMILAGVATLGVAAFPLGRDPGGPADLHHAICAVAGYIGTAGAPLLAAPAIAAAGRPRAALLARLVSGCSAVALGTSALVATPGLPQRIGLTVVDAWFVAIALQVLARPGPVAATRRVS